MITTITEIEKSPFITFDEAVLHAAHLKVGDQVNVTVNEAGVISVTPLQRNSTTPPKSIEAIPPDLAATFAHADARPRAEGSVGPLTRHAPATRHPPIRH